MINRSGLYARRWMLRGWVRIVLCSLLLPWLSACRAESTISTNVIGYNHTNKTIGSFTVAIGESSSGGGFLRAHQASGFSCCVSFPNPWRPGLTAVIGWTDDFDENYQERVVAIEPYDAEHTIQLSVHFLRNGEIKVFIPPVGPGNPNYPLRGPEAGLSPGEDPVEVWKYGRKNGEK